MPGKGFGGGAGRAQPAAQWPFLDELSWKQFELAMADVFQSQGYLVTVTPDGADGGVDLILDGGSGRVLVQCKHWSAWKVGVPTVRELYGVMAAQQATAGMVVTTGHFTQEARSFAASVGIHLLERRQVGPLIAAQLGVPVTSAHLSQGTPPGSATAAAGPAGSPTSSTTPRCPRCGEWMVLRTPRRGRRAGRDGSPPAAPGVGESAGGSGAGATQFWGCPRFPTCRGVLPLDPATPATVSGTPPEAVRRAAENTSQHSRAPAESAAGVGRPAWSGASSSVAHARPPTSRRAGARHGREAGPGRRPGARSSRGSRLAAVAGVLLFVAIMALWLLPALQRALPAPQERLPAGSGPTGGAAGGAPASPDSAEGATSSDGVVRSLPSGSWLTVVESLPKAEVAVTEALRRAAELSPAGHVVVVDSDAIPGLNAGYWALSLTGAQTSAEARERCGLVGRVPGPTCYPREVG